jgi:steroid delta-isomerase-like uncharacterized protein
MSQEEMKQKIAWAGKEAWLEGNLDALDEVYADDYVFHRPPLPDLNGLAAAKEYIGRTREAYSDLQVSYDEMIAEGNSIAYRYTWRGHHTGQSQALPIPPAGKEVTLVGTVVLHVKDGKVVEEFEYSDYLGFLQQLGIVPPLG